jgi:hypothetical protein
LSVRGDGLPVNQLSRCGERRRCSGNEDRQLRGLLRAVIDTPLSNHLCLTAQFRHARGPEESRNLNSCSGTAAGFKVYVRMPLSP